MKKRTKSWLAASSVICALAVGAVYYRYVKVDYGYDPIPFSEVAWARASYEERGYMCGDLLAKQLLKGKTEKEVIEILGAPDSKGTNTLYYKVGYLGLNPRAMMVFSYALLIRMNENGRVFETIVND